MERASDNIENSSGNEADSLGGGQPFQKGHG
jgi:hypothetical protein